MEKDKTLQFQVCFSKLDERFIFSIDIVSQSVYQLDTMYRVGVNSVAYAHQFDTLYRVGVKRYGFITQLDTLYRVELYIHIF